MKEFQAVFQLSKTIIFEVNFYTLSTNQTPHFSTSAAQFARNKKDFTRCGQAQMELTKGFLTARRFFLKWDKHHLHNLTPAQEELDESRRPYSPHFSFYRLAEWTKQDPRKKAANGGEVVA